MATVTAPQQSAAALSDSTSSVPVVRIEPPRGWLELRLDEVWEYRELLYFFMWRDIKIRYKQTAVGVLWVVLQPLMILAVATALAVGLWTSALNALYRDVAAILPFLIQFWMLASPVAYPSSLVPEKWRWLYGLNPMAGVIDGFRWALTGRGQPPNPILLASGTAVAMVGLGGLFFFNRMETAMADRV